MQIGSAFVSGSVVEGLDTAARDIDLMVVSERLTRADLFTAMEEAVKQHGHRAGLLP